MNRINLKGILIFLAVLVIIQYGTGFLLSPAVTELVQDNINKYSKAKVTIDKASIWPVSLSLSIKGIKVYDPDNISQRIIDIENAAVRLSVIGALSKRLVLSEISADKVEVTLIGEPDGSFNLERLGGAKAGPGQNLFGGIFKGQNDIFSKVYDGLKKRFSKENIEKKKKQRESAKAVKRIIKDLPRGKLVEFKAPKDMYLLEVKELDLKNARINFTGSKKERIDIEKAKVNIKGLAYDPANGAGIRGFSLKGALSKDNVMAGEIEIRANADMIRDGERDELVIKARGVDMKSVDFIYADSLPLTVQKGKIDLTSETVITNGELESANRIILKDHYVEAKDPNAVILSFVPISVLCDALNQTQPVDLGFRVTGTLEKPEIKNFEDMLLRLVKPYISNIGQNVAQQGMKFLNKYIKTGDSQAQAQGNTEPGSADVEKTLDSIKNLFNQKK